MKKVLNYLKNNWLYVSVLLIGIILFLIQMSKVVMCADDFYLKRVANEGLKAIIINQYNHYFTWGGGFTPIIVTSFLLCNFYIWKIFITGLVVLIINLSIKMFNINDQKEKTLFTIIFFSCIFTSNIELLKQTFYWLDGSMAYVFTAFQVFIYIYYLITRIFQNKKRKSDVFFFPFFAFFAGWSSAQTGAISFLVPILMILFAKYINKKKISLLSFISCALGIIGFGIFYFAPGNSARMSAIPFFDSLGFVDKILYRVSTIFQLMFDFQSSESMTLPFFIILFISLLVVLSCKLIKKSNKQYLLKISTFYLICYLFSIVYIKLQLPGFNELQLKIMTFVSLYNEEITIAKLIPYIFSLSIIFASLINGFYISKAKNSEAIFYFPLICYLSQGIMVMAPYSECRTEFLSIIFIWLAIALLFIIIKKEKISFISLICIPFMIVNINFIYIFILITLLIYLTNSFVSNKTDMEVSFVVILILFLSFYSWNDTYRKYSENKKIYDVNMSILENYNGTDEVIYLKKMPYPKYEYISLVGLEYFEQPLKKIYNIDFDVKFMLE